MIDSPRALNIISTQVINANVSMMRILDMQQIASLLSMIGAAEEHIDFLERHTFGLWDEEPDKDGEEDIGSHEEEERFPIAKLAPFPPISGKNDLQSTIRIKRREELVEDALGDVLHLRAHSHGLRSDVHGENLGSPNPSRGTPGWFVEENEEE